VQTFEVGDVIAGKYAVTRVLGRGGMGAYAARAEVACREAAHATAGGVLKLRIKEIRIGAGVLDSKGGRFLGGVVPDWKTILGVGGAWTKERKEGLNMDGLVMCLAGPAGQQMRYDRCTGHVIDMQNALAYSSKIGGGSASLRDLGDGFTLARQRAKGILTKHRDAWSRLTAVHAGLDEQALRARAADLSGLEVEHP
jgi:hypothetical protein